MAQNGLTPVSYKMHGHRFWRRFKSYDFARDLTDCPIVEAEVLQGAAAFPIVFKAADAGVEPVALLSMTHGASTPFVSADGTWLATYVPSALRCPPFHASRIEPKNAITNQFQLFVDETLGLVTDKPSDEAFFDESGVLAPELQKVSAFFQARIAAAEETARLCDVIAEMNLFAPVANHHGIEFPDETLGINSKALKGLSQAQKTMLASSGALRLIHAHQISLSHSSWLTQAQLQAGQAENQSRLNSMPSVSDFLDAIATAQHSEQRLESREGENLHASV
ncbi:SapC family protein [uncultured Ruegeria sp.]|uniref:SapC family protein n=1 Tax=uncultured Ruegeria sp. TaxID=259304 RepID=UPI0034421C23